MKFKLTTKMLRKAGADCDSLIIFKRLFPDGATLTLTNLRRAIKGGNTYGDISWLAGERPDLAEALLPLYVAAGPGAGSISSAAFAAPTWTERLYEHYVKAEPPAFDVRWADNYVPAWSKRLRKKYPEAFKT